MTSRTDFIRFLFSRGFLHAQASIVNIFRDVKKELLFNLCKISAQILREIDSCKCTTRRQYHVKFRCYVKLDASVRRHGEIENVATGLPVITDEMEMETLNIEPLEKNRGVEPDNRSVISGYV
jgi:hypothetical protein